MIRTQSADGMTHEFPDETPPEAVDKAMKSYAEERKDKSTVGGEMAHGFMDPIEGGAQLLAKITPAPIERAVNSANNWLADKTGLVGRLPEGGMDEHVKQRESDIQKERGDNTSLDWSRMAGNILNPINYIGGLGTGGVALKGAELVGGGKALANVTRAVTGGAVSGAEQPVTSDNYGTEKGLQIGVGGTIGLGAGAVGSAASKGAEKFGEYLARNYPENLTANAVQKILRRIKQDEKAGGPSATDAITLVNEAKKPLALVDVAGENVRGLGGNVARQPGAARTVASQFLNKRDEQAAARLSEDVSSHLFGGPTMFQATEGLLQARSAASRPAYEAVHDLKNIWSPKLDGFLQDPVVKEGLKRGYEIERMQALAEGRPITASQMGVDLGIDGEVKLVDKPNMRLLDMAKQGLDAIIAAERDPLTGRLSARGVAIDKMRRAYVETIDDLDTSGAYKKARATWAGYSQSLDAVRQGRAAFKTSPEENAAAVEAMSPANKEFYRLGLADVLKERLAKAGLSGDEAKTLIKNPWMRDQLKPAFRSREDFDNFVEAVTAESQMFATRRATLGGSETAGRLAEDADGGMMSAGAQIGGKLIKGQLFSAAKTAWQLYNDIGLKPNPELNEKIAQILFSENIPEDVARQLKATVRRPKLANPAENTARNIEGVSQGLASSLSVDATKERPMTRVVITPAEKYLNRNQQDSSQ